MAELLSQLFVDPKTLPEGIFGSLQVLFLGGVYGKVLFDASNQISDGSELLLLIPSLAGIVGSVVLPVLGIVPDIHKWFQRNSEIFIRCRTGWCDCPLFGFWSPSPRTIECRCRRSGRIDDYALDTTLGSKCLRWTRES